MKQSCTAKKFGDRMSHKGGGKSAGEKKLGNISKDLTANKSSYSQSKRGNGGK